MSHYLRTYSDAEFGAIAEVVDDESGEVIASCAASPPRTDGLMVIVDESQIFQHGYLLPPDLWAACVRATDTLNAKEPPGHHP